MDIHRHKQKIDTQCEKLKVSRDGPPAVGFLNHMGARGLSEGGLLVCVQDDGPVGFSSENQCQCEDALKESLGG